MIARRLAAVGKAFPPVDVRGTWRCDTKGSSRL
jgi:hypothetical protein